jgi:predicted O-linked N-acetylglucosamine transferase (SPINDLY family)
MPPAEMRRRGAGALQEAVKLHRAGQLEAAAALYAEALAADAKHPDALHLSGVLAHQQGRHAEAIAAITRAIETAPSVPEFYQARGVAYRAAGDIPAAEADFGRAAGLNPKYLEAWVNLGIARLQREDPPAALQAFQQAVQLAPNVAEVQGYFGTAQLRAGAIDAAITALKRAVALDRNFTEAYYNLGIAYDRRGEVKAAEAAWRRSIEANPFYLKPWNNLGVLLHKQGRAAEARACFERALSQAGPDAKDTAELWNNLANVLDEQGLVDAALQAYQRAVTLRPDDARFHLGFGGALLTVGKLDEAFVHITRARELDPALALAAECGLMGLLYVSEDAKAPLAAATAWANSLVLPPAVGHANSRDPDRRLRVGYVSPDFFHHPVANFIAPVLAAHDRSTVEVFCYAEVKAPDAVTERLRRLVESADHWRDTTGMSDESLASAIRADGIDILIDLAGHTVGGRLLTFARKPAPVQATWLGYPATTGLTQIDWRITDPLADPPGLTEDQYSEKLLRLPTGFNCYQPIDDMPAVAPLPSDANGYVTFGCFNHAAKIRDKTLDVWAELLKSVPDARLCLKHRGFSLPSTVAEYRYGFERRGVAATRVDLISFIDDPRRHLAAYDRVDIALDPFPYNGTTTTCEALWMGVPVVALAGDTHMSRVGVSLLTRGGLPELVADRPAQYVEIAARLAADRERLRGLRRDLRDRIAGSPVCDAALVTRELETALRQVWREWCRTHAN